MASPADSAGADHSVSQWITGVGCYLGIDSIKALALFVVDGDLPESIRCHCEELTRVIFHGDSAGGNWSPEEIVLRIAALGIVGPIYRAEWPRRLHHAPLIVRYPRLGQVRSVLGPKLRNQL